ncbi:MAG: LysR family transcriptional regulator [Sphingomonadales bacterium]|nr:LysR family transcriptional regulator [Sphingomonadales bacterium]MDE2167896.1 LysR family transcriptional regulator [Sphingomonadales bacterium]
MLKIKIQLYCGEDIAMGPGKADLLDAIVAHGSISAAGRALGMSYRRAWLLVDTMNRCWDKPLVETSPGRSAQGGARLTERGRDVLNAYRALQASLGEGAQGADAIFLETVMLGQPRLARGTPD